MNATRRTILYAAPAFLAACGTTSTVDVTQAITDARTIIDGIAGPLGGPPGIYQQFLTLYPGAVSPAQQAAIDGYIQAARQALTQLSATASALANGTNLQAIEIATANILSALSSVAASIPGVPVTITGAIAAAQVLLPLIEVVVSQLLGRPPVVAVSAARVGMSPDTARMTLRAAAVRR